MMNEYKPVSVYTCTQDFPNFLPNGTLFCYHFSTALRGFFFSKSLPLHFNLKLFTMGKVEKMLVPVTFQTLSHFFRIHMSLHPTIVHKTIHDPFELLHTRGLRRMRSHNLWRITPPDTRGLRKMRSHNLWRITPPDSRVASTIPPSTFS